MATRNSQQEAVALKIELQQRHPTATFKIIDRSKTMRVGRLAAEAEGYEILEDGKIMVLAAVTQFDVLEVRRCACGAEILTAAIGEYSLDECESCRTARLSRQERELDERIERSRQEVVVRETFDQYSEPH